jgi:hypothetical protein
MTLVISLSGGETSAFMALRLYLEFKAGHLKRYNQIAVVFANTGQEHEATLKFVNEFSRYFNIPVDWVESVTRFNVRKASTYRLTDYRNADRHGKVYQSMIEKYGIPNAAYLHCTRELKNVPIREWCKDRWGKEYEIAIGIRLDEKQRVPKKNTWRTIYPLIDYGITKQDVIEFWRKMPFRLEIENYQGNCQWCWKKSNTKLSLIAWESPNVFDFPSRMERDLGLAGHNVDGTKRVFFRGNKSTNDILSYSKSSITSKAEYLATREKVISDYEGSLFEGGCSESCEAFV